MNVRQDTYDLEAELRAMLRRQAEGVDPHPPQWTELTRRAKTVVVSLHTGRPVDVDDVDERRHSRPRHRHTRTQAWWRQPSVVGVAAAILTIVGMWAIDRVASEHTPTPTAQATPVPAPGDPSFDPRTAPIIWPSNQSTAVEATREYLDAVGIHAMDPDAVTVVESDNDGAVAKVEWTVVRSPGAAPSTGTVYLRNLTEGATSAHWVVVGAAADEVQLEDVRYDGVNLAFTVVNTADVSDGGVGGLALTIFADDQPVPFGGDPIPQGAPPEEQLGQLVDIGSEPGARAPIEVDLVGRPDVVLRVRHVAGPGDESTSVTEMALEAPALGDPAAHAPTSVGRTTAGGGGTSSTSDTPLRMDGVSPPAGTDGDPETTLPGDPDVTEPPEVSEPSTTTTTDVPVTTTETTLPITVPTLPATISGGHAGLNLP